MSVPEDLARRIAELEARTAATEAGLAAAKKTAALDEVLDSFRFVSEAARCAARALLDEAAQVCQGQVIADGRPLPDYARELFITHRPWMIAPIPTYGSGAHAGISPAHRPGPVWMGTMEMIRPGIGADERAAVMRAICAALRESRA